MIEYQNNVVILGDGQLGSCIREMTGWDYISRKKDGIDARKKLQQELFSKIINGGYEQVLNCIGYTDTYSNEKEIHWDVNYQFVSKLADFCSGDNEEQCHLNLIHISTDYVYAKSEPFASEHDVPIHCGNWYGYTKLLGDGYVQLKCPEYLVIRCSFKPDPFPYPQALINQIGNFDTTEKIAELIVKLIRGYAQGVVNVGTEVKTIYDLAKRSNPRVKPVEKMIHRTMPTDITMNCSKMKDFI